MTTRQRGNQAEAKALSALVSRGLNVLIPFGEAHPYDLLVDLNDSGFLRMQCKAGRRVDGCVQFKARSTDHGRGPRSYVGAADIFGVYFPEQDSVYLVPIAGVAAFEGRLRLEAAKNNQKRHVRYAAEFEIDSWTPERLALLTPSSRQSDATAFPLP
jgi:hypothetical protein